MDSGERDHEPGPIGHKNTLKLISASSAHWYPTAGRMVRIPALSFKCSLVLHSGLGGVFSPTRVTFQPTASEGSRWTIRSKHLVEKPRRFTGHSSPSIDVLAPNSRIPICRNVIDAHVGSSRAQ